MFVDLVGFGVVDDVDVFDPFVVLLDPGVDPERLDADDLFLLVGHGAGDVHHVHDAGDAIGLVDFLPTAILFIGADRDDQRIGGVVGSRRDLALPGAFEGAVGVTQRLGPGLADAGVFVLGRDDVLFAFGLDARQSELLAEDVGKFFEGEIDLQDMAARLIAGAALAVAAGSLVSIAELRQLDRGDRNADVIAPFFADHLPARNVLGKVGFHLAAHNLAEALMIAFDFLSHCFTQSPLANVPVLAKQKPFSSQSDLDPPNSAPAWSYSAFAWRNHRPNRQTRCGI